MAVFAHPNRYDHAFMATNCVAKGTSLYEIVKREEGIGDQIVSLTDYFCADPGNVDS